MRTVRIRNHMMIIILIGMIVCVFGLIIGLPPIIRTRRYSETTIGRIEEIRMSNTTEDNALKITYSYEVSGQKFIKTSGWISYGKYKKSGNCSVKYDPEDPEKSYIKGSGNAVKAIVGSAFFVAGLAIIVFGLLIVSHM